MTKIAATAKRRPRGSKINTLPPMSEMVKIILGCTYDVDDMPLHLQALVALGGYNQLLTHPKDRRFFGAGFILALRLANIGTTLINMPKTKETAVKDSVKAAVAEAKALILESGPPYVGEPLWDRINDIFWHGKVTTKKAIVPTLPSIRQ